MQVQTVSLDSLHSDPANARKHSARNIKSIAASLQRFGQQKPIVVDSSNVVRAGNGTLEAARSLNWTALDVVFTDLQSAEATAFAIADNRTAELAEWDDDVLAASLQGLDDELQAAAGYEGKELDQILSTLDAGEIVEDEVPEPPAEPKTKPGDLWILGDHRLLCGDSTMQEDVDRLMGGLKADACVTDPPYNIDFGNNKHRKFKVREIANDNMTSDKFAKFCAAFVEQIKRVVTGCVYSFGQPGSDGRIMFTAFDKALHCSTTIVWNKDQFVLGRGKYQNKYEPCWFGWVESGANFTDDRTLTNVWDFARPKRSDEHPTMKPLPLIAQAIKHCTVAKNLIYEPFCGSGTTLIAAEQLGRKCYGIELSPQYCDVIVERWQNLTGKEAKLDA
jgi:DNA modification methylase